MTTIPQMTVTDISILTSQVDLKSHHQSPRPREAHGMNPGEQAVFLFLGI